MQQGSRLSFSMENRSFDNAGPAPQAQGESSIILLLACKRHLAGSFSPNHFREIYLGRLSGSTLHHRQAFVFSSPCCVSMHRMLHPPQSLSIPMLSLRTLLACRVGPGLPIWLDRGWPPTTFFDHTLIMLLLNRYRPAVLFDN